MVILGDENIELLSEAISKNHNFIQYYGRKLTNQQLIDNKCEILLTRSQTQINQNLLENTKVKLVATATSGTDHFDIQYLKKADIEYYDAKGCNANSVAEYVLFSILYWSDLKNINLNEKSIGIIGFGSIGKIVAFYAKSIGLKVFVNDPLLKDDDFNFPKYVIYKEIDDLITESNILTNHIPLTYDGKYPTFNLLNESNLSLLKPNSLIIHASRGKVANEDALIKLYLDKNISLVIDVWENEPEFNVELAEIALISTPHIAGYSYNGKLNGTKILLSILLEKFNIKSDINLIDINLNIVKSKSIGDFISRNEILNDLKKYREIETDSQNLKSFLKKDREERCILFDLLRKKYPKRFEIINPDLI